MDDKLIEFFQKIGLGVGIAMIVFLVVLIILNLSRFL